MKKKYFIYLSMLSCLLCFLSCSLLAENNYPPLLPVYEEIADICHPTLDDYRTIQQYLTHGERPGIELMGDKEQKARRLRIIGPIPEEVPEFGDIAVNCDPSERENCLIVYCSYNQNYPRGLNRLVNVVKNSDFKGHILYRIGGWPDVEGGSLVLAHVPYAFKVCFFKEAQRLGYKRALWLDASIIPLVSLNDTFEIIEKQGYYIMGRNNMLRPYITEEAAAAFYLTLDDTAKIPNCNAGIFGFDFTSNIGTEIVEECYWAAHDKYAYFSSGSDQNILAIIAYRMGLQFGDYRCVSGNRKHVYKDPIFYEDHASVRGFRNQW